MELFSDSFDLDKSRDTATCKMEGKALAMQEVELVVKLVEALRELLADGKIQKLMLAVFFFFLSKCKKRWEPERRAVTSSFF